jgi:hypothetical protein
VTGTGAKLRVGTPGAGVAPGMGGGTKRAGRVSSGLLDAAGSGESFVAAAALRVTVGGDEGSPGRRSVSSTVCV